MTFPQIVQYFQKLNLKRGRRAMLLELPPQWAGKDGVYQKFKELNDTTMAEIIMMTNRFTKQKVAVPMSLAEHGFDLLEFVDNHSQERAVLHVIGHPDKEVLCITLLPEVSAVDAVNEATEATAAKNESSMCKKCSFNEDMTESTEATAAYSDMEQDQSSNMAAPVGLPVRPSCAAHVKPSPTKAPAKQEEWADTACSGGAYIEKSIGSDEEDTAEQQDWKEGCWPGKDGVKGYLALLKKHKDSVAMKSEVPETDTKPGSVLPEKKRKNVKSEGPVKGKIVKVKEERAEVKSLQESKTPLAAAFAKAKTTAACEMGWHPPLPGCKG